MQALFFFALFGLFFSVVQGLISGGAISAIQLKQSQLDGTTVFFRDFENLINQQVIPQSLRVPDLGNNITAYLDQDLVKEGVNWNYSTKTTEDPWNSAFDGFVVHQRTAVRSQAGGGQVHLPITAFVLVSAGPDRVIDPTLRARLNGLSATSEVRDVLNIDASTNTDDIVYTFSTFAALEDRWQEIEDRINETAQAASRQYTTNYLIFLEQLLNVYGANYLTFFNDEGLLNFSAANISQWRADGIITPLPDMVNFEDGDFFGSGGAKDYIENETNLRLRFEAFRSANGVRSAECRSTIPLTLSDHLRICVTNNGSPWGDDSGRLFYYRDVQGERS